MHRHEKISILLKSIISEIHNLERKDFDDERKRSNACEKINDELHKAYSMINELKKEFQEKL
ncbi:hypothetical protein H8D36_03465 [archaeon]|nr:hypothetical protein [archaeon]MBL7056844.1 hypothetical protein [Candidatus Woesearchaeota archaeon]